MASIDTVLDHESIAATTDETAVRGPRRVLGFAMPDRTTLAAMAAFAVLCLVLVAGSEPRRIGDGGEYTAMAWQFANLRPPALSLDDIALLDQHYADLGDRMSGFEGSAPTYQNLLSDGRYDQLHFWIYPLMAAPGVKVAKWLGQPDTYAFAALNIALATFTFGVVMRRKGLFVAALLFLSPLLWWIDKAHGEVLVFCVLLLALLWVRDRPHLGFICMAVLTAHNLSFSIVMVAYAITMLLLHGRTVFDSRRKWAALVAAGVIAAAHPLYYLQRLRIVEPTMVLEDNSLRIPTVTRYVTPIVDPYVGLVVWWPFLVAAVCVGAVARAWSRPVVRRTAREWAVVWSPFVMGLAVLFAQAQNNQPGSGGTFAMSRYAIWIAPFAVYAFPDRSPGEGRATPHRFTPRSAAATTVVLASLLLSLHVARPATPDVWFTVKPTLVAQELHEHAPWLWNTPPQLFLTREWRQYGKVEPVANEACTKLLAVSGTWPTTCPAPTDVPRDCATTLFCYANRSGDHYTFVPVRYYG
ncbi:MAG: hypothetical protein Q8M22_05295 [Actinomycetota bacterium]|nr:hypothetical protein [Actinomycetota bacterium]